MKTAWLAGATGLIGGHLLPLLLERYDRVVAFTRRPLPLHNDKLVVASIDTLNADGPVDDVYCALGTTIRKAGSEEAFRQVDLELPLRLASAGLQHGAKRFLLVSSVGASAQSGTFYLRVKGELEDRLAALGFEALHIYRPSFLIGNREEQRTGESAGIVLAKAIAFALVGPLRNYRAIEAETVAKAMVNASGTGRRVYHYDDIRAQATSSVASA